MKQLCKFGLLVFLALSFDGHICFADASIKKGESKQGDSVLQILKESELSPQEKNSSLRIYRAMIAPTWGNRYCIRVQNQGEGALMVLKRLDGQAGYGDGKLVEEKEFRLTANEFQELEELVNKSGFEKMGLRDPDSGLDGESWSLEVSKAEFNHKAVRWSPNYDMKKRATEGFVKVFRWLADRAGVTDRITNKGHSVFKQ